MDIYPEFRLTLKFQTAMLEFFQALHIRSSYPHPIDTALWCHTYFANQHSVDFNDGTLDTKKHFSKYCVTYQSISTKPLARYTKYFESNFIRIQFYH